MARRRDRSRGGRDPGICVQRINPCGPRSTPGAISAKRVYSPPGGEADAALAAASKGRARRGPGRDCRACRARAGRRGQSAADLAQRPRDRLGPSRRARSPLLRRQRPLRDPAAGTARRARSPGAGLDPQAAHRSGCLDRLALGQGKRRQPAPEPAQGADPGRLPRQRRGGGEEHRPLPRPHARRTDQAPGAGGGERLRQPLAGDDRRVGALDRPGRVDRDPLPAAGPAARLPLAGRGGDTARLRRRRRDRLARRARDRRPLDPDRRLRPDRLLDDGLGPGGRLRPLDGLALPRGAGGRHRRRWRRRG